MNIDLRNINDDLEKIITDAMAQRNLSTGAKAIRHIIRQYPLQRTEIDRLSKKILELQEVNDQLNNERKQYTIFFEKLKGFLSD